MKYKIQTRSAESKIWTDFSGDLHVFPTRGEAFNYMVGMIRDGVCSPEQLRITYDSLDVQALTDDQLTECLYEMRRRGAAAACYDVAEILELLDGHGSVTEDEVEAWFDRNSLEELMCNAVRDQIEMDFPDSDDDENED
jgi:hypothetical protein